MPIDTERTGMLWIIVPCRYIDALCRFLRLFDILRGDIAEALDLNAAPRVERLDVLAGDPHGDGADLEAGRLLGCLDGLLVARTVASIST